MHMQRNISSHTPALFHSLSRSFHISHSYIFEILKPVSYFFFIYSRNAFVLFMLIRFWCLLCLNFNQRSKKQMSIHICVMCLVYFFVSFCLYHLNVPLKINTNTHIFTHTFTCKHKWKWPTRYAHFNAYKRIKKKLFNSHHIHLRFALRHHLVEHFSGQSTVCVCVCLNC